LPVPKGHDVYISPTIPRPVGFALATYPVQAHKRAILVALERETGDALKWISFGPWTIGVLREPLETCARIVEAEFAKQNVDLDPQDDEEEDSQGTKEEEDDPNVHHHGLYSISMSAHASKPLSPLPKWHIRLLSFEAESGMRQKCMKQARDLFCREERFFMTFDRMNELPPSPFLDTAE